MKFVFKRRMIFLAFVIFLFESCSKKDITNTTPPSPPSPPVLPPPTQCENKPVINVTLMPVGNLSVGRINMLTAYAVNKILFIGGYPENGIHAYDPIPVDIYDLVTNTWSTVSINGNESFRDGAAVASVGNKILFAGGGDPVGDFQTSKVD